MLRTPEGAAALAAAAELVEHGPLVAAPALRARGFPADLASAALTQAELRRRAVPKFGADAAEMFFTRAGLEQATRSVVARRRADRLRSAGVGTIADLGCGIGADTIAFARAGIRVYAVEADPATADLAAANVAALGLAGSVTVSCAQARSVDVTGVDAVFCDPARRSGTGRRVFDPSSYSPSWDFVAGLPARVPRTVLKLAPGIDHALIPPGAEAEWVSVDGDVVEAVFWCGPLAGVPRRATVLRGSPAATSHGSSAAPAVHGSPAAPAVFGSSTPVGSSVFSLTGDGVTQAPVAPVGAFVYDPDGAVLRAHLVAEFASTVDGAVADPTIAYVYGATPVATPFARCFRVDAVLPWSLKRLRAELRTRGVGRVEIRKRGSAVDPQWLRPRLRLSGSAEATVILARAAGRPVALICTASPPP